MMKLYREHVLKEQPGPELVQIGGIAPASQRVEDREESGPSATRRGSALSPEECRTFPVGEAGWRPVASVPRASRSITVKPR